MKRLFFLSALLLFVSFPLLAGPTLVTDSLYSPALQRVKRFNVILPDGYEKDGKYPVLYLLHGFSGDYTDWTRRSRLAEYAEGHEFIVVMPDAEDSWYVNAIREPREKFELFIMVDLPAYVKEYYAVDTTCQAIAGLSMGGYGATMLALRHPGTFVFVGGLSSALTIPGDIASRRAANPDAPLVKSLVRIFGETDSPSRAAYDVFALLRRSQPAQLPYFYYAMGLQDPYASFLPAHRSFTDSLRVMGVGYEYHEVSGGHTWEFWDREIQPLLRRLDDVITETRANKRQAKR